MGELVRKIARDEKASTKSSERYARLTKPDKDPAPSNFLVAAWHGVKQAFGGLHHVRRGLETVAMHTWREPTTEAYPDKAPELPPHFRGRLALTVNPETGENLCISCRQCERVCPDKCIEITAHKSPETNKLELIDFKIDHGLCMFCGLCTEVCPTYCIINTNDFEMADYSRGALIYDLKKLTLTQEESAYYFAAKEMPLPKPKPVKAAAAPAAAKPAAGATPAAGVPSAAAIAAKPAAATEAKPAETKAGGTATPAVKPETAAQPAAATAPKSVVAPAPKTEEAAAVPPVATGNAKTEAMETKAAKPAKAETKPEEKEPKTEDEATKDQPGDKPTGNV